VTALINHDRRIGAGVVLGSNVFNLAAAIAITTATGTSETGRTNSNGMNAS
jgi:Ca2+/Na+ antiporter